MRLLILLLLALAWPARAAPRRTKLQRYFLNATTAGASSLPSTCGDGSPAGFFSSELADDESARADALRGELKVVICKRRRSTSLCPSSSAAAAASTRLAAFPEAQSGPGRTARCPA